jgi:hypothetical protein
MDVSTPSRQNPSHNQDAQCQGEAHGGPDPTHRVGGCVHAASRWTAVTGWAMAVDWRGVDTGSARKPAACCPRTGTEPSPGDIQRDLPTLRRQDHLGNCRYILHVRKLQGSLRSLAVRAVPDAHGRDQARCEHMPEVQRSSYPQRLSWRLRNAMPVRSTRRQETRALVRLRREPRHATARSHHGRGRSQAPRQAE